MDTGEHFESAPEFVKVPSRLPKTTSAFSAGVTAARYVAGLGGSWGVFPRSMSPTKENVTGVWLVAALESVALVVEVDSVVDVNAAAFVGPAESEIAMPAVTTAARTSTPTPTAIRRRTVKPRGLVLRRWAGARR